MSTRRRRRDLHVWREAIVASMARQQARAGEWLRAEYDRVAAAYGLDGEARARVERQRVESATERKRLARQDPAYRAREAAQARYRTGVLPREERLALVRARSEATREEREQRKREKARQRYIERAEEERERMRQRRAAMTLEERRAEWREHQRARRARLRAQQEAAE